MGRVPTLSARGAAFAAVVVLTTACSDASRETHTSSNPAAVTTTRAAMSELAERLEAGALVGAATSATLSSRVLAPVLDMRVQAGARVRAGQVLVVLDSRDLVAHAQGATASLAASRQGLDAAQTERAAADAELKLARAWHARIETLHARKAATTQELEEASARLSSAEARLAGAAARIEQARSVVIAARASADAAATTSSFATITAPFDGLVTETFTDAGDLATPGAPLLRIDAAGGLQVEARVDESRAGFVHEGDRVEVLFEGAGAPAVEGRVAEIARAVAASERTFTVKISLPKGYSVRTGTYARVRFRGSPRRALTVPGSAVRRQGQVSTVFVVQEGVARLRLIRTGQEVEDRVEVLAGLDAGELVVTRPPAGLTDGQRVSAAQAVTEQP